MLELQWSEILQRDPEFHHWEEALTSRCSMGPLPKTLKLFLFISGSCNSFTLPHMKSLAYIIPFLILC